MATFCDGTSSRSSPGYGVSTPPLKKYVTCAYFSVSAVRNMVRPWSDSTWATISDSTIGPNAIGKGKVSSYWVIVTRSTGGLVPVSKPSNPSIASARTIWRMRSAR